MAPSVPCLPGFTSHPPASVSVSLPLRLLHSQKLLGVGRFHTEVVKNPWLAHISPEVALVIPRVGLLRSLELPVSPVWLVWWLQIPAMVRVSRRAGTAGGSWCSAWSLYVNTATAWMKSQQYNSSAFLQCLLHWHEISAAPSDEPPKTNGWD